MSVLVSNFIIVVRYAIIVHIKGISNRITDRGRELISLQHGIELNETYTVTSHASLTVPADLYFYQSFL